MAGLSTPAITGAFAEVLRSDRAELNARVAAVRQSAPALDPDTVTSVLRDLVAPVVEAAEAAVPGSARRVGIELFDVALELAVSGRTAGIVATVWTDLLPAAAAAVAVAPRRVVGALCNAVVTLDTARGARAEEWCGRMRALAGTGADPDVLLRGGQVAAWRCGMAGYRAGALALARTLDPPALAAVLDVDAAGLDALGADPWATAGGTRLAGPVRVGGFRGFGGPFVRPPFLEAGFDARTGAVVANDGDERWLVVADGFGWAVGRAGEGSGREHPAGGIAGRGTPVPDAVLAAGIDEPLSWCPVPGALAVTSALTHAVVFLPGVGP